MTTFGRRLSGNYWRAPGLAEAFLERRGKQLEEAHLLPSRDAGDEVANDTLERAVNHASGHHSGGTHPWA